jgi:hypothetical protein
MDKGLRVKMDGKRLEELCRMYKELIHEYEVDTDHKELLFAHMRDFHHRLKVMDARDQSEYTLAISDVESLAFRQLWAEVKWNPRSWSGLIVRSLMEKIDRRLGNLKLLPQRV